MNGTTQLIPEINTVAGLLGNTYVACRLVRINADGSKVEGTPQGGRVPCTMEQTY
ncbi:MAG TPA: hypothetical protein VII06_07525 [Chloroflexota bacterium]